MARVTEQAVGEKVLKSLDPEPAARRHRLSGADQPDGPGRSLAAPARRRHRPDAVRPARFRQNDHLRQAGRLLKQRGRKPLLVAADLQRPAAIEQLQVLGEQLGMPVYAELHGQRSRSPSARPPSSKPRSSGADVVILDTAGRLHVDDELMDQLEQIDRRVEPDQVYLVVDGMTGQDAVNSAKAFNEALELDGVIMTKLDGDARGGAALSVKASHRRADQVHRHRRASRRPRRVPSRPHGRPHPGHGRHAHAGRAGAAEVRPGGDGRSRRSGSRKGEFTLDDFRKHARPDRSKLGPMQQDDEHDPRHGRHDAR